jgi:hypothetical protein
MIDLDEMAEEHDRMLRELAELGMDFARDLKAQVKLVKSVEDAGLLARAYERVVRGVRLTLALRERLVKDRLETARLQRDAASRAADRRKAQVRAVLEPEIFTEDADQEKADQLRERLIERLDDDALFDEFLHAPFSVAVAQIRKDLGLPEQPPSSPVTTGEGDHPPKSGWWRGQAKPPAEPWPPPPRPLRDVVPLPRCAGEEKKKPAPS